MSDKLIGTLAGLLFLFLTCVGWIVFGISGVPSPFDLLLGSIIAFAVTMSVLWLIYMLNVRVIMRQLERNLEKGVDSAISYLDAQLQLHPRFYNLVLMKMNFLVCGGYFEAFYTLFNQQAIACDKKWARQPLYKSVRLIKLYLDFLNGQLNPEEVLQVAYIPSSPNKRADAPDVVSIIFVSYVNNDFQRSFTEAEKQCKVLTVDIFQFTLNYIMGLCKQQLGQPDEAQTYFDKLPQYAINQLTKDLANQYASSQPQN